jgi:hypothetical protein
MFKGEGEKKGCFFITYLRQWSTKVLFMLLENSQEGRRSNCRIPNLVSEEKK